MQVTKEDFPHIKCLILGINNATHAEPGSWVSVATLEEAASLTGLSHDRYETLILLLKDFGVILLMLDDVCLTKNCIRLTEKGLAFAGILMGM